LAPGASVTTLTIDPSGTHLHRIEHAFSVLFVRSPSTPESDLTTRARIRDVAVDLIGREGFPRVTVRQVAQAARVSPGLVIHHFGSKEGLRRACDERVQQVLSESIAELEQQGPASAMAQLARADEYLPVVRYGTRALLDGGPLAQHLFDRLVDETQGWLAASVASGQVRAADDDHARAALLVCISLGMQLLDRYLAPDVPAEQRASAVINSMAGSAVELYTHGLFTTTEYLDAFRRRNDPAPSSSTRRSTPSRTRNRPPDSRRRTSEGDDKT
jgi:AcrR family transcriptional regulator